MSPQARWTVPVNIRPRDKPILDAAVALAEKEGTDITTVFRNAVAEYVRTKLAGNGISRKMDDYFDSSLHSPLKLLSREELKQWTDSDVISAAKQVRARKHELESELRRRGYYFRW